MFIKSELKVGVMYVREDQCTEETILANNEHSPQFEEFLTILGEKVRLKGILYNVVVVVVVVVGGVGVVAVAVVAVFAVIGSALGGV